MQNLVMMFTFSVFDHILLGQIWSKNSKLFKMKFDAKTNSNMQIPMVFIFSFLEWKSPFWANLVEKIKIVNLS